MLSTLSDDTETTSISADVMQKIWKPISDNHSFPTTAQWFHRLEQAIELPADFPAKLIDKAKKVAAELHQDMGDPVLLHGDLHHFNILSSERQPWLAIDPKGVVSEREYEVGALLRNPIPFITTTMDTKKILTRRVDLLTELLGFDRQRIVSWGFAQAVLAAVWSVDGNSLGSKKKGQTNANSYLPESSPRASIEKAIKQLEAYSVKCKDCYTPLNDALKKVTEICNNALADAKRLLEPSPDREVDYGDTTGNNNRLTH